MPNDDIPQALRSRTAFGRQLLIQAAVRRDQLAADLRALTCKPIDQSDAPQLVEAQHAKTHELRQAKAHVAELKQALRQLLDDCHRYEPSISGASNLAGHPLHLRMPATRSRCWSHAVRPPSRDDT
jgi:hypothetical protein